MKTSDLLQVKRHGVSLEIGNNVVVNKDYLRLENKPSINGIELNGNKTAVELSVLSNNSDTYEEVSRKSANKADFLLLVNNRDNAKKMPLREISQHMVQTLENIPEDLEIGNYVFLLKEDKHGTNKE